MKDEEFVRLCASLGHLSLMGVFTVVFNVSEETKIRKAIEDRYGESPYPKDLYLRNVKLVFV